jgi:hypothetical protein
LVSSKELNDENVRINCQKALKDLSLWLNFCFFLNFSLKLIFG